jgi:hypothetical protein
MYQDDYFGRNYERLISRRNLPPGSATFFNNLVFERVFPPLGRRPAERETEAFYRSPFQRVVPRLNKPHLQIIYAIMYSACFHKNKKMARLSAMDIARLSGIDWRTVQSDLFWLTQSGDIHVEKEGYSKARTWHEKTLYSVPLANFDIQKEHFTPVPRFIVKHYVPAYPRAILLPVLQYIRQWRRFDGYWVQRVQDITGWPQRTIYRALKVLGNDHTWYVGEDGEPEGEYPMPCPLKLDPQKFTLRYLDFRGPHGMSICLNREFAKHFEVGLTDDSDVRR